MSTRRTDDDLLRQSIIQINQLRAALKLAETASKEPIAIVAMACRAPGGVVDPEGYWALLDEGRDAIGPFPARWNVAALYDPDPEAVGKTYVREGGFIEDVEQFDASFFNISPREAIEMDPQQRLVLEVAWEALERAGLRPVEAADLLTGVYIGSIGSDYGSDHPSLDMVTGYTGTGTLASIISGRLAYVLGLQGPAMTIDTACSSSLVALHLACAALRQGECDLALAGGVQVISTPAGFVGSSRQRVLAPDGRCKPFSAAADGAGWSEGCGIVVLKRLSEARRAGDRILAVMRGSAVNQDGRSQGLTAPNGPSQQRVVQRALAVSGLVPDDIDAMEAHGTGTSLGDPIEAGALAEVFGPTRSEDRPLWLGSSKSNIGHAQAAAGILGVIKMVLALEQERLPRTLYVDEPSPHVAWQGSGLALLQEARPWVREAGRLRRAGVSSFGISGTNAHIVIEEAPREVVGEEAGSKGPGLGSLPLVVSGRDEAALRSQAGRWSEWLGSHPQADLAAVIRTAAVNRTHFDARAAVQADDVGQAQEALEALAQGRAHPAVSTGTARLLGGVVFVFPGQGSQWPGMGRALLAESAVFADAIAACDAALLPHTGWSVRAVLGGDDGEEVPPLDRVDVVQPVLFAMAIGLAAVWRSLGVRPDAVIGHSQGEIAAAVVAGALSLEDGARIAAVRSKLVRQLAGGGGMAVIELPVDAVEGLLERDGLSLSIAVVNTPTSTVVSGDREAIEQFVGRRTEEGVFCRRVDVDYASHSAQVDGILGELKEALHGVQPRAASVGMFSTVTGEPLEGTELDAQYWCRNLRQPVRLDRGLDGLLAQGHGVFIEVSAHPVLAMPLTTACAGVQGAVVGSLRRDAGGLATLHRNLGVLHTQGYAVSWGALLAEVAGPVVALPTYAFQRQRYWLEAPKPTAWLDTVRTADLERDLSIEARNVLPEVLAALRQHQDTASATAQDGFYGLRWHKLVGSDERPSAEGSWLVLTDGTPHSEAVIATLREYGGTCTILETGHNAALERGIDSTDANILAEQFRRLAPELERPWRGAICLWGSIEAETRGEMPAGIAACLHAIQGIIKADLDVPLWILTRSAAATEDGPSEPVIASERALWGLAWVLRLEHPRLFGGVIDLPCKITPQPSGILARALTDHHQEAVVALRRDAMWAWRIERSRLPGDFWTPRGTVLVTGGLGGIGRSVSLWLAKSGAEHLVLTSRRGDEHPEAATLRAELEKLGARVTVERVDVTACDQVSLLMDKLRDAEPPVRAVFHLAAVLDDALLVNQTDETFQTVWRPKARAARLLDLATRDVALDAFVLFSSAASLLGNFGIANYALANAYLDGLALERRAAGLPALSINWGMWAGAGFGAKVNLAHRDVEKKFGMREMAPSAALSSLERLLSAPPAQAVIADFGTTDTRAALPAAMAMHSVLGELIHGADDTSEKLHQRLTNVPAGELKQALVALVQAEVAAVLRLPSSSAVAADRPLKELGLDSLTALELSNRLSAKAETRLPPTLAFDQPSAIAIADFLAARLLGAPAFVAHHHSSHVSGDEPIAIVAIACRTPGGAVDPDSYWRLLEKGVDAIGPFPERWNVEAIYNQNPEASGKTYAREGGFLTDVDCFDAAFFSISPREAISMDPQQRLLLEVAWEALERAGVTPNGVKQLAAGVFVGTTGSDYGLDCHDLLQGLDSYSATGRASSVLSGRLSYALGLQGPSLTIDTACSSSLVALHLACTALRRHECDLALAGGVQVMSTPALFVQFSRMRGLAPDGRCKSFSDAADGSGFSEGCGLVVLKRLNDARRDGDRVLALVRGSAVNQDGRSQGLTAPNGPSQQRVIFQALAASGLGPDDLDAIEAHGTGTTLGDPIEAEALREVFARGGPRRKPVRLGSCKSNLGHTQAAAGILGAIKMVLAIQKERLPKTLHADMPSSKVHWEGSGLALLQQSEPWHRDPERPRRAGVSSFGISGTNAHVILEEAPPEDPSREAPQVTRPSLEILPVIISGNTVEALRANAGRLAQHLGGSSGKAPSLCDLAFSLATRTTFPLRLSLPVNAKDAEGEYLDLCRDLNVFADEGVLPSQSHASFVEPASGKLAVLFAGQGSQRVNMGRELHGRPGLSVFTEAFDAALKACDQHLDRPLLEVMWANERENESSRPLDRTHYTQAALFVLETALYRQWQAWGLQPDLLIGHSIGELVAAHLAGILQLSDAAALVCARGLLMEKLAMPDGAMASVEASEEEVHQALTALEETLPRASLTVALAAVNAPRQTVVSGDAEAIDRFLSHFARSDKKARRLRVSHAFHSAHMDSMLAAFGEVAAGLTYRDPEIPIISNVTGQLANPSAGDLTSSEYWVRHIRQTVRFFDGVRAAAQAGVSSFLECGPDAALSQLTARCLAVGADSGSRAIVLPSLSARADELSCLVSAVGGLHTNGVAIDWNGIFQETEARRIELPTYAFQRERYWSPLRVPAPTSDDPAWHSTHLPGRHIPLGDNRHLFELQIGAPLQPELADHVIQQQVIVAGAWQIAALLTAFQQVWPGQPIQLEEVLFVAPIILPHKHAVTRLLVELTPTNEQRYSFTLRQDFGDFVAQTKGFASLTAVDFEAVAPSMPSQADPRALLDVIEKGPVHFGPLWLWHDALAVDGESAIVQLSPPSENAGGDMAVPGALLDGGIALHAVLFPQSEDRLPPVPYSIERVRWTGAPLRVAVATGHADFPASSDEMRVMHAAFFDESGRQALELKRVTLRKVNLRRHQDAMLFALHHRPIELAEAEGGSGAVACSPSELPPQGHALLDLRAELRLDPTRARADFLRHIQAVQAMTRDRIPDRITVLTCGALGSGTEIDPVATSICGLVRTARLEIPQVPILLVDTPDLDAAGFMQHRWDPDAGELMLDRGALYRSELRALAPGGVPTVRPLDPNCTVVITGGTGALGSRVAQHLVSAHGMKHIALVSRSGASAAVAHSLEPALLNAGAANVDFFAVDLADREAVKGLLGDLDRRRPVGAIVHAAGVLHDELLRDVSEDALARVVGPKLDAALAIDTASRALLQLTHFIMFSSAAGLLGSPGQASYAVANAGLDGLAQRRRAEGLPATSIAWGPWDVGMAATLSDTHKARLRDRGMAPLTTSEALALLDRAILRDEPVLLAARLDMVALGELSADAVPALLRSLAKPERGRRTSRKTLQGTGALARELAGLDDALKRERIERIVRSELAHVLGLKSPGAIDPNLPLQNTGVDSMMAIELQERLAKVTNVELPATFAFDYPTPAAMIQMLLDRLAPAKTTRVPRVAEHSLRHDEPIAIIAASCRFPGQVEDLDGLWNLLANGTDAVTEVPQSRWDVDAYYDPDPEAVGKSYCRWGGFIGGLESYDAGFCGISPGEAPSVDPQERLLLETAWEAVEQAGFTQDELSGTRTGVYVGIAATDYQLQTFLQPERIDAYSLLGSVHSTIVGRLSYWLGLQGPNLAVDTACSSSLVALDLAIQALRNRTCDLAFAGGVNTVLSPIGFVCFSRLGALSRTGRCRAFSADADGYVRGEGCGLVLIKRLSDARRDGDPVLAVIRGSAVNQDGRSNGFTAPNGPAQQACIRNALAQAGIEPGTVDAVECHGTGTVLGDPIEVQAIAAVYGEARPMESPVRIGTIKSNIGHTEGAAGIAGVLKAVVSLKHRSFAKSLHFSAPNPNVRWDDMNVRVCTDTESWPRGRHPRRIGVSSFGISGTNAHVILEEAPEPTASAADFVPRAPATLPLLVSGRDDGALKAQAARWAAWLRGTPDIQWPDVISTAAVRRTQFAVRASIHAESALDAAEILDALAEGRAHPGLAVGEAKSRGAVVFVFPGQGSQWPEMGRALLSESEVFAQTVAACDHALRPYTGWSVLEMLRGDLDKELPPLDRVDVVQPALFAMAVGLAAVWQSLGVAPAAVVGHSQGEIAAAVVAGGLSLEDGARVVALRSKLLRGLAGNGAMAVVELPVDSVEHLLLDFGPELSVAVVNTMTSTVVSGSTQAIDALTARLSETGVYCRLVDVDYASHSLQVEPILPALAAALADISPAACAIPMISTVTGNAIEPGQLDAHYWCRNLREPVRLDRAIEKLSVGGHGVFVEASAHPVLAIPLTTACAETGGVVVGSLRRGAGNMACLHRVLGLLHAQGHFVNWRNLFPSAKGLARLPTYPFQRKRYWVDAARPNSDANSFGVSPTEHPLLSAAIPLADGVGQLLTGRLCASEHRWLSEHRVFGTTIVPGTGVLEMMLAGARAVGLASIEELVLLAPLAVPERGAQRVQLQLDAPDERGRRSCKLYARNEAASDEPWQCHATGLLAAEPGSPPRYVDLETWPPRGAQPVDLKEVYLRLADCGLFYGPAFQGLTEAYRDGRCLYARARLPADLAGTASAYAIHPALLDAALHSLAAEAGSPSGSPPRTLLPFAWSGVTLHATGAAEIRVRFELSNAADGEAVASIVVCDAAANYVLTAAGLQMLSTSAEQVQAASAPTRRDLYRVNWQEVTLPDAHMESCAVVGSSEGLARALGANAIRDVAALRAALDAGESVPKCLIFDATHASPENRTLPEHVHDVAAAMLDQIRELLAEPRLATTSVILVTRGAIASGPDDRVEDLARAPLWGLFRSAGRDSPDRSFRMIDVDTVPTGPENMRGLFAADAEPELALRRGVIMAPRLAVANDKSDSLCSSAPSDEWRLCHKTPGILENFVGTDAEAAHSALGPGQVRIAVRAAGVNFRDVLNALGIVPAPWLGLELAGVVVGVGEGVTDVSLGDRVMGLGQDTFATVAIADVRLIVRIPEHLSFAEAAALPVAYLTALYALEDVAALRSGERVLVHAATGGVGMAAVQLSRLIGAEVFATAGPTKWPVLEGMQFEMSRIANSRDAMSISSLMDATGGEGMDVVLGALSGDFVDASLRLLPRGGRYIEMGKTDIRDRHVVCEGHPGVVYRAIDLWDAGPERIRMLLQRLCLLLREGRLQPLPLSAFDLRYAPAALRFMRNARHVGKVVLQPPRSLERSGTVLITGGAGSLGQAVARHLVSRHGVRHVLLTSRRGLDFPGGPELVADLQRLGADTATLMTCDVTDYAQVRSIIDGVPANRPLTAVFHLAGILDDGMVRELTRERLVSVLRPKVDGAWNLHRLTTHLDLSAFVLFSSAAGVLGGAGQANYAAANTFLDALAAHRRSRGLAALSLAWGLWAPQGEGMTAHLTEIDLSRLRRQGMEPLSIDAGLALLDAALGRPEATLIPVELDASRLQRLYDGGVAPALLRGLLRPALPKVSAAALESAAFRQRISALPEAERKGALLDMVREEVAAVSGAASTASVPPARALKEIGLDSLMAVELRNRLSVRSGVQLPATLAFDYPTPERIAGFLAEKLELDELPKAPWSDDEIRKKLSRISIESLARSGVLSDLMKFPDQSEIATADDASDQMRELINSVSDESLLDLAGQILET